MSFSFFCVASDPFYPPFNQNSPFLSPLCRASWADFYSSLKATWTLLSKQQNAIISASLNNFLSKQKSSTWDSRRLFLLFFLLVEAFLPYSEINFPMMWTSYVSLMYLAHFIIVYLIVDFVCFRFPIYVSTDKAPSRLKALKSAKNNEKRTRSLVGNIIGTWFWLLTFQITSRFVVLSIFLSSTKVLRFN